MAGPCHREVPAHTPITGGYFPVSGGSGGPTSPGDPCPRDVLERPSNNQRLPPAVTGELEASASFEAASNAREHAPPSPGNRAEGGQAPHQRGCRPRQVGRGHLRVGALRSRAVGAHADRTGLARLVGAQPPPMMTIFDLMVRVPAGRVAALFRPLVRCPGRRGGGRRPARW